MSGPKTDKTGQIQRAQPSAGDQLAAMVVRMGPALARALPKHVTAERISRIVLTAIRMNPDLGKCTQHSFIGCVLSAAQLGLEVNTPTGQAYLIPRQNRKLGTTDCTIIIGYKGLMELARRSGSVSGLQAHVVRAGDHFEWALGTDPKIVHIPSDAEDREQRPITHAYAVAKVNGEPVFTVLSVSQIEAFRKRSSASNSGPWLTDYSAMCCKTAMRRLCTWLPMSAERDRAVALDEAPERGMQQSTAFDPAITEALKSGGLIEAEHEDRPSKPESDPGQPYDTETGEVAEAPAGVNPAG